MFRNYYDRVRTPKTEKKQHEVITNAYNCNLCDKGGWLTPNDVEIHKKNAHSRLIHEYKKHEDRFCTVCMTLFVSNIELIKHIKSQHLLSSPNAHRVERLIYICDECSNIFFNKDVLAIHMTSVHLSKESNLKQSFFTCPKCFRNCRLKTMWFHLQLHDIPSVSLCDICLNSCPDRTVLREHLKLHKRYLKCEPCGYISTIPILFNSHMEQHKQRTPQQGEIPPNVLNSVFKKRKNKIIRYNMHNAIKGLNLPKFMHICTLCREICVSSGEKRRHILRDHMLEEVGKKMYLCTCGEEFEYKVMLKQHLLKMKGSHRAVDDNVPDTSSADTTTLQQNSIQNEPENTEVTLNAEVSLIKTIKLKKLELVKIEIEMANEMDSEQDEDADKTPDEFASLTLIKDTSENSSKE